MSGGLPLFLVCLLALIAAATAKFFRSPQIAQELPSKLQRTLRGEVRHQASSLLAVTGEATSATIKEHAHLPDSCNGNQYAWMANMMKKCQGMFGPESYWDHQRKPFCERSFKHCRPHYGDCCAQPDGPTSLSAYCDLQSVRKRELQDPACAVQTKIRVLQDLMAKIPDVANRILASKPRTPTTAGPSDSWDVRDIGTMSAVADDSYHDKGDHDPKVPSQPMVDMTSRQFDIGGAFTVLAQGGPQVQSVETGPQVAREVVKASEAAVESTGSGVQKMRPAEWQRIFAPPTREVHCGELSHVLGEMKEKVRQLGEWRQANTGSKYDPTSMMNQDPELLYNVEKLVVAGAMLQDKGDACSPASSHQNDHDDDDDDDVVPGTMGHSFLRSLRRLKSIVVDEFEGENSNQIENDLRVRMDGYMGYIDYIGFDVLSIETKVHPHGDRWWRYRYEQTLMEAMLHIPLFVSFFLVHHFISNVAAATVPPNGAGLRAGQRVSTSGLFRHLTSSCMQNSATVAVIMFAIWILYASTPLFDWFAVAVREVWEICIDDMADHCIFESVPFSGRAYYIMVTSIAMSLFGSCMLYSLIVWQFLRISTQFLNLLQASDQSPHPWISSSTCFSQSKAEAHDIQQYLAFQELFCDHLSKMKKSGRLRDCAKAIGLDLDRHVTQPITQEDLKKVRFHRYFVVSLDHAAHDVALWSPTLPFTLVACCCLVAILAGWKSLSFAWFLPGILAISFLMLGLSQWLKRALWSSISKEKGDVFLEPIKHQPAPASMPWLSAKRWMVAVQTVLFIWCYVFSRFILSPSIWTEYKWLVLWALAGFAVLICLLRFCISDLMIRMVCVLSLPPNAASEVLEDYLEHMAVVAVDGKAEY